MGKIGALLNNVGESSIDVNSIINNLNGTNYMEELNSKSLLYGWVSINEINRILGISKKDIMKLVNDNRLTVIPIGKSIMIKIWSIECYLNNENDLGKVI
jgi:hypothetical protein